MISATCDFAIKSYDGDTITINGNYMLMFLLIKGDFVTILFTKIIRRKVKGHLEIKPIAIVTSNK